MRFIWRCCWWCWAVAKLSAKQLAFCREYLKDYNATQAAIRAGYSAHTAKQQGARQLTKAAIITEVGRLQEQKQERGGIDAEYIISELKDVARLAKKDKQWAAVNRALELLGKTLAMFTDRQLTEMGGPCTVKLDLGEDDSEEA